MTFTLTLDWWVVPLAITAASFLTATLRTARYRSHGDYDFGQAFVFLLSFSAALIVSLVVWLMWALLAV